MPGSVGYARPEGAGGTLRPASSSSNSGGGPPDINASRMARISRMVSGWGPEDSAPCEARGPMDADLAKAGAWVGAQAGCADVCVDWVGTGSTAEEGMGQVGWAGAGVVASAWAWDAAAVRVREASSIVWAGG